MARFHYECECGHYFTTFAQEGESLKCPHCDRQVRVSFQIKDPSKDKDFERFADATFEIMGEGGFSPSGAG